MRHPWLGNLATRLKIEFNSDWCPTAAVDGRTLFFNPEFMEKLSPSELYFVVAHEVMHLVYGHLFRSHHFFSVLNNKFNQLAFMAATDYKVNNFLVKEKIGSVPSFIEIYQDFKYDDMSFEEVYASLMKDIEENGGSPSPGSDLHENSDKQTVDSHDSWNDDGNGENDSDSDSNKGEGQHQKGKGFGSFSEQEKKEIEQEFREALISAVKTGGSGIPSDIKKIVSELTEHKISWRDVIRTNINSQYKSDFSFVRPSKKSQTSYGAILPGMLNQQLMDVCVAIDTSGSISDEQAMDFLSEVNGIMEEYEDHRIDVMCFDTGVHNHQVFSTENGNSEEIRSYQPIGGGGTIFQCVFDYLKEEDIEPKLLIIFSDMYDYGDEFGDPDYCDTLFINHGRTGFSAPYGVTVEYDEYD